MEEFYIMFADLTPAAQESLLNVYRIASPEEMNWDVFPVTVLDVDTALESRAADLMDSLTGTAQEKKSQLEELVANGEITKSFYDYIIENWDLFT